MGRVGSVRQEQDDGGRTKGGRETGSMPRPAPCVPRTWPLSLLLTLFLAACTPEAEPGGVTPETLAASLRTHQVDAWYPRVIDPEHGGYLSRFTYDWQPEGPQDKMMVTQARHVWSLSRLAAFYPAEADTFRAMAAHGVAFLRDVLWDAEHGGFRHLVTREGTPITDGGNRFKLAYDQAFGLYGLAAYVAVSGDTAALALAQEAFRWLEAHSHDPEHGGYFQFMEPDGTPLPDGTAATPPKDQNSSIHLLEAFTALYAVWPDPLVRERLREMRDLVRDVLPDERGFLRLFFRRDWSPVSFRDSTAAVREANYRLDHVSFGHDVETAFLLLEASAALGEPDDPATRAVAERFVEHALAHGWDAEHGGFYDAGYYLPGTDSVTIISDTKQWWAQAEALHTLLLMAHEVPAQAARYREYFEAQWRHIDRYLIDHEHGGWYPYALDTSPASRRALKAQIWKGNYHTARALMGCLRLLGTEAARSAVSAAPARPPAAGG